MTDPIDPIRRARRARAARHVADRDVEPVERATETGGLPVPAGPVRVHAPEPAPGGG
ncbi:hypothetical protein G3573_05195, partial [Caulobacter sp. 17J65-9]|nr:hypothetical protein [Caulobacter sp. 17J65-9]